MTGAEAWHRQGVEPHGPVLDTLFRALAVLRLAVLVNAVGIYVVRYPGYDHPVVGALVMAFLAGWTVFVVWAYGAASRRRPWLLVSDLAVAVAAIALSPYVKGEGWSATLPGFWVMGVMLAWAILWRWAGGLAAALVVSVADLGIRADLTQQAYGNVFLLLLGGAIVGFLSGLLQETANQRDRAEREAAAAAERQRLARVVHDGVLQVLALVQRRAPALGDEGADLGRIAGEQEARLRALVQHGSREPADADADEDLVALLSGLARPHVHISVPGTPVTAPAPVAREMAAAVEACLSNVRHHVGREAPAWVLLEELADRWVVSVRDQGPGIAPGRLEASAAEGRLGVSHSIVGRLHDLGGSATLHSAPGQGTEWELTVPRTTTLGGHA